LERVKIGELEFEVRKNVDDIPERSWCKANPQICERHKTVDDLCCTLQLEEHCVSPSNFAGVFNYGKVMCIKWIVGSVFHTFGRFSRTRIFQY
jgi:hypothetical protein